MDQKDCFGILEKVFPLMENGLREVPSDCMECPYRVRCLKAAISTKEGIEMSAERLEKIPVRGFLGRLKRWSERKELSHRLEKSLEKRRK